MVAQKRVVEQKPSFRLQFKFWLDVERQEEEALAEYVHELKEKRMFASTIRDALRLIWDLRNGNLDILFILFPWVYSTIYAQAKADLEANTVVPEQPIGAIQEQLQRLESLMLAAGNVPYIPMPKPDSLPEFEITESATAAEDTTAAMLAALDEF